MMQKHIQNANLYATRNNVDRLTDNDLFLNQDVTQR